MATVYIYTQSQRCAKTGHAGYGFHITCAKGTVQGRGAFKRLYHYKAVANAHGIFNTVKWAIACGYASYNDRIVVHNASKEAITELVRSGEYTATQFRMMLDVYSITVQFKHRYNSRIMVVCSRNAGKVVKRLTQLTGIQSKSDLIKGFTHV